MSTLRYKLISAIVATSLIVLATFLAPNSSSAPKSLHSTSALLHNVAPDLNQVVLNKALRAYQNAVREGHDHQHILTIIDYSLPSSKKRLWSFDVAHNRLLFHTLVAHGRYSGNLMANSFSNRSSSKKSSLGLFATANTYYGHDGYALRIRGLEPGVNNNAMRRAVVMHGARYVSQDFVNRTGRLGRSWGCPAIPLNVVKPLINTIKNDTLIFAYYPNQNWLSHSKYLR